MAANETSVGIMLWYFDLLECLVCKTGQIILLIISSIFFLACSLLVFYNTTDNLSYVSVKYAGSNFTTEGIMKRLTFKLGVVIV